MKSAKKEFLVFAASLNADEKQHVLSKIRGKFQRKVMKGKIGDDEAIALQLESEEENLKEWKKNIEKIRKADVEAEKSKMKK